MESVSVSSCRGLSIILNWNHLEVFVAAICFSKIGKGSYVAEFVSNRMN